MAATTPTHTKVFVGNLSYKTRDGGLKEAFSAAGLNVVSANIISRGTRSMGYGFVEFENETEAKRAVEVMNKKELDGRDINVELANPREETDKTQRVSPSGGYRGRGGRGGGRGGRGRGGRGGGRGGWGAPRGGRGGWGRGRGRGGRGRGRGRGGYFGGGGYTRRQGNPSPTTLFVANLPFSMDDNGLGDTFKDLKIKSAHVVKRANGRSKGFGFVEFHSQDDQQAALNALAKKVVEGRELIIRVALSSQDGQPKVEGAEGEAPNTNAPPPTTTTTTTTTTTSAAPAAAAPATEKKGDEKTGN